MFHKIESSLTIEIDNYFEAISSKMRKQENCGNFEPCSILGDGNVCADCF